jgi:predicted oxidoreductase
MKIPSIAVTPEGPELSCLVAGFWRLAEWDMTPGALLGFVEECLELGITTFDHADIYGDYTCEDIFGRALAGRSALRDRLELVTKCGIKLVSPRRPEHTVKHYDTGKAHILASVENSLRVLGTDRIDVLLIHRPDPCMDPDETAAAFVALKEAGKVLHFGVSNFTPSQFDLLASRLPFPLVTNQVAFSVLNMQVLEDGTIDQCQRLRIAPMAWSPLAGGELFTGQREQVVRVRNALEHVGTEVGGASIDQVALAWLLNHPSRTIPILGTGKRDRVRSAARAVDLELSREQWYTIWIASQGREVP